MANLDSIQTEVQISVVERVNAFKTLDTLNALPGEIFHIEAMLAATRDERDAYERAEVKPAQEALEHATLAASMEAPCDGKNAETRKMQLDLYLAKDTRVQAAKRNLREREQQLAEYDSNISKIAWLEIDLREAQNRFRAALAASALQAEIIRAYTRN